MAGEVEESCAGTGSTVAGWPGEVRVGGSIPADARNLVGLVGEGGDWDSDGRRLRSEAVRTLLEPSTKSTILTAELR